MVKEEPEEEQNHSDVGLFVRSKCLLKYTVIFYACAETCDVPKAAYRRKKCRGFNAKTQ